MEFLRRGVWEARDPLEAFLQQGVRHSRRNGDPRACLASRRALFAAVTRPSRSKRLEQPPVAGSLDPSELSVAAGGVDSATTDGYTPSMTISREDPRFWDVRTLERRVRKGLINRKDVEKHLKSLDDSKDRVAPPPEDDDSELAG
jgi:hypothetical protein